MGLPLFEMKWSGKPVAIIKTGDRQLRFVKIQKFHSKYFYVKEIGVFELDDSYEYRYGGCAVYFYNFANSKPISLSAMLEVTEHLDKNGESHLLNRDALVASLPVDTDMSQIQLPPDPSEEMTSPTRQFLDDFAFEDERSKTDIMLQVHDSKKSPTPYVSADLIGIGINRGSWAIVQIGKNTLDFCQMYLNRDRAYTKYGVFHVSKDSVYALKKQFISIFISSDDGNEYSIPMPKKAEKTMKGMVFKKSWNRLESFTKPFSQKLSKKNDEIKTQPEKTNVSLSSEKPLIQFSADSPHIYHTTLKTLYSSRQVVMENLSSNMKKVIPIALIFGGVMALMIVMSNLPMVIDTVAKYTNTTQRIVYVTPEQAIADGLDPALLPVDPRSGIGDPPPDATDEVSPTTNFDESGNFIPSPLSQLGSGDPNLDENGIPIPLDVTAPVIEVPETIELYSDTRNGLLVKYAVKATDDVDGTIGVTCDPKFNSFMEVGITTVNCISSDNAGNVARASFDVIITGDPQPLTSAIVPQIQMPPLQ